MTIYKILINGKMLYGENYLEIKSPLNNEIVGAIPALEKKEVDYAFQSARKAFPKWASLLPKERIEYILEFKKILIREQNFLAFKMVEEISKTYDDCILEIQRSCEYVEETIKCYLEKIVVRKIIGEDETNIKGKIGYFERIPVGVTLAISPFNYPVNLALSKIIPALLVGNSVVFKPATQGSITGAILADFFYKSKFPAGTINIVTGKGSEIGDYLIKNNDINVISFTGSPEIGNKIRKTRGDANLILELGGKDAAIIEHDANIDFSIKEIIKGAFDYSGQRCTAIKIVYADELNKKEIIKKLTSKILNLSIGSPHEKVNIVPLINNNALKFSLELIDDAKKKKGKILTGGQSDGNFLFPTLIEMKNLNSRIMNEEQFSPILPIYFYKKEDIDKIIININKSNYALQASIFTELKDNFWEIARKINVGTVNWNKASSRGPDIFPFLGIKDSGQGIQGIYYALESMTRIKGYIENK